MLPLTRLHAFRLTRELGSYLQAGDGERQPFPWSREGCVGVTPQSGTGPRVIPRESCEQ